jgi:hypothetical protein
MKIVLDKIWREADSTNQSASWTLPFAQKSIPGRCMDVGLAVRFKKTVDENPKKCNCVFVTGSAWCVPVGM